jgi:hypothetical protein
LPRSNPHVLILIVLTLCIIEACATTSQAEFRAGEFSLARPDTVSTIGDFVPHWQSLTGEQGPFFGVEVLGGTISDPPLEFWAVRADLSDPRIGIVVGPQPLEEKPGINPPNKVPSIKVSSFVRDYGCIAGINANPFDPSTGTEGEDRAVAGLAISGGTLIAAPHGRYDALVFYTAGPFTSQFPRAAVLSQAALETGTPPWNIENAVGGFYRVLEGGEVTGRNGARHPRSAAGLSGGGDILYLLVIDGRRPGSRGATEAETGQLLRQLGAAEGLCFDGGGSSALALRPPGNSASAGNPPVRVLNKPMHRIIPGTERAVAICLGITFQRKGFL